MVRTPLQTAVRQLQSVLNKTQLASLSDDDLLERFHRRREDAAFAVLVERHGGLVWRACRQILHQEQDAEDCYQASFLVLARHAASIRRGQTVACWLYRVASRIARKAAMDRAKRRHHEQARPHPRVTQPVHDLSWRELQDLLGQELTRLPDKYQAPFVLCCIDGKSKSQAAQQLGWKVGTVSSRLAHARSVIQQRLTRRGIVLAAVLCSADLVLRPSPAPAALAKSTAAAASWLRAGRSITEFLSSQVIALMEGASKTMFLSKLNKSITLVLALGLLGSGSWALAWQHGSLETQPQDTRVTLASKFDDNKESDAAGPAKPPDSPPGKPWIGFASRETTAGPELSIQFEDGTRRTYQADADTVLLSYLADQPLGGHESLSVDLADSNRVLLRFDWPRTAKVEKAELILSRSQSRHPYPSEPMTLAFHTVREPWNEFTATWNRQPAFSRRPALTTQLNPLQKEYRIDVTRLVRLAEETPQHGWLIRIARPVVAEKAKVEGKRPSGWSFLRDEYIYALDSSVTHSGAYSCRIESRDDHPSDFAMMWQNIRADKYRGQRVRFSGYVKTEGLKGMATLWLRIDGESGLLGIDKTVEHAVRGTSDWQRPEIVLDVPTESKTIRFAVLVEGAGTAWVDDLKLESVERTVPVTNPKGQARNQERKPELPLRPVNLGFEENGGG